MIKKFLCLLIAGMLSLTALASCSKENDDNSKEDTSSQTVSSEITSGEASDEETSEESTNEDAVSEDSVGEDQVSSEEASSEAEHVHTATSKYMDFDMNRHRNICECGEIFDEGEHDFDDFGYCEVCRVKKPMDYEPIVSDNTLQYSLFGEDGHLILAKKYDEDGNFISEVRAEYVYSDSGEVQNVKIYENGELFTEGEYSVNSEGETYVSKKIMYYGEDGKTVLEYDENYNVLKAIDYDSDGKIINEAVYEYEFDDDFNVIGEKTYENGELISENEYSIDSDGYSYISKEITYNEDGGKSVTEYDEYYSPTKEIEYDADGNVLFELVYEYQYDEQFNVIGEKVYENGTLTEEYEYIIAGEDVYGIPYVVKEIIYTEEMTVRTEYTYDGDYYISTSKVYKDDVLTIENVYSVGEYGEYVSLMTMYSEEGSVVSEINEDGDIISVKVYDTEGNLIG